MGLDKIRRTMTIDKYIDIRANIHFNDNELIDAEDGYYKIRPILDRLLENFGKIEWERRFSLDEAITPYKGRRAGGLKVYNKNKPHKWGFKLYTLAGVSGFVYDILPFAGSRTFYGREKMDLSFNATEKTVITLSRKLLPESVLYFDNYFNSLDLLHILRRDYNLNALGTVRSNKIHRVDMSFKNNPERGAMTERHDKEKRISIVNWRDQKDVLLASNFIGIDPVDDASRYVKKENKRSNFPRPAAVREYNSHMGGVDRADMLVSLYRCPFRSKRWYLHLFGQLLDFAINNAWILYRKDCNFYDPSQKAMPLKQFRLELAITLMHNDREITRIYDPISEGQKIKQPKQIRPVQSLQYDHVQHYPGVGNLHRCKFCTIGRSTIICLKCNVNLKKVK